MKKIWLSGSAEAVSPVIATILLVAITVVLAAVLYATLSQLGPQGTSAPPVIGTTKTTNNTDWLFTVTAISGSRTVFLSDVFIQIKNTTSFVITTEPILNASGTHGFKLVQGNPGAQTLQVGDVLSLSKTYAVGTTITLVNPEATGQYALLTI